MSRRVLFLPDLGRADGIAVVLSERTVVVALQFPFPCRGGCPSRATERQVEVLDAVEGGYCSKGRTFSAEHAVLPMSRHCSRYIRTVRIFVKNAHSRR